MLRVRQTPPEAAISADSSLVAVDIWSTGCIFAEMLEGKPLFPGKDRQCPTSARHYMRLLMSGGIVWHRREPVLHHYGIAGHSSR